MNKKYDPDFSFYPMTSFKAYVLGLAWADGWITSDGNTFAIASKDNMELSLIRDNIYPNGRPLTVREDGVNVLYVSSRRIAAELLNFGFTPTKSRHGAPIIPIGLEQFFVLGILDGDGTVFYSNESRQILRVFFSGNKQALELIEKFCTQNVNCKFSWGTRKGKYFGDTAGCMVIQTSSKSDAVNLLSWLYSNLDDYQVPFLYRKYDKFVQFQSDQLGAICNLCPTIIENNHKYCDKCNILLRRLKNRQQDHKKRNGVNIPLQHLVTQAESKSIYVQNLKDLQNTSQKDC
jgi:hypothetical protein